MDPNAILPDITDRYYDIGGRTLFVTHVDIGAPDGREVIGQISMSSKSAIGLDYSCDLKTWRAVWMEKAPRWKGKN